MFAKRNKRAEKYSLHGSGQRESEEEEEDADREEEEEERRRRCEEEERTRQREGRVKTFLADERLLAGKRMKDKRKGWAESGRWSEAGGMEEEEEDEEGKDEADRMPGVFGGANLRSRGKYN